MKLAINGIGAVGGFGCGTDALASALHSGRCEPGRAAVKTTRGPVEIPVYLADTSRLEDFVNKRALRRIDHFSKMALLGAHLALKEAGKLEEDHSRMGVIVATGYGAAHTTYDFLDSFLLQSDSFSSPTCFSSSVHNAAAASISMLLDITGPGLTVSQFEMSAASALLAARSWLEEGRVDSVLFGTVDEYCDVLGYCWHRFYGEKAAAPHEMRPLEFNMQSAIPGEGAAFFLLTAEGKETVSPYGFIEDILIGRCSGGKIGATQGTRLFIGADGNMTFSSYYMNHLPGGVPTTCYTPLYGSLPTGQAFDIAIAAISRMNGKVFPSPGTGGCADIPERPLGDDKIDCITIGGEGELASVILC